jgi:hypothetical protein
MSILRSYLIVFVLLWVCAGIAFFLDDPLNNRSFDSITWKDSHEIYSGYNPRGEMLFDLTGRVLVKGLKETEAKRLLGPANYPGEPCDTYNLGLWAEGLDSYMSLLICYEDGLVDSVKSNPPQ